MFAFRIAMAFRRVPVFSFFAVCSGPDEGALELLLVIDFFLQSPHKLSHIDALDPHAQIILEERLIHDRSSDAHRHPAEGEIALAAHESHS